MSEGNSKFKMRVFEVILSATVAASLALTAWCFRSVISHGETLATITGNRFTSGDGLAIWREIASIREQLARLPSESPPKWFADKVNSIDTRVTNMEDRIDKRLLTIQDTLAANAAVLATVKTQLDELQLKHRTEKQ